jgi:predicted GNAT family acetyltransferase
VPYVPDAAAFTGWNTLAAMVRGGGRLVGAADSVGPLWQALRRRLGGPRPILDRPQYLYRLDKDAMQPAPRTTLRKARSDELDEVVDAHARMIAEDEGYDPQEMAAKRFRRAVAGRIERNNVWIVSAGDGIQFKVDVSADCRLGVQFAGVYTAPAHRRKGLARACLADLATRVFERRPQVTLHVDCKNAPAIRTYESVGFVRDMDFRMVVLGY